MKIKKGDIVSVKMPSSEDIVTVEVRILKVKDKIFKGVGCIGRFGNPIVTMPYQYFWFDFTDIVSK